MKIHAPIPAIIIDSDNIAIRIVSLFENAETTKGSGEKIQIHAAMMLHFT